MDDVLHVATCDGEDVHMRCCAVLCCAGYAGS